MTGLRLRPAPGVSAEAGRALAACSSPVPRRLMSPDSAALVIGSAETPLEDVPGRAGSGQP